jgi:hypothetical protein
MRCPRCQGEQDDDRVECAHCGVIFNRYRPRPAPAERADTLWERLRERMFQVQPCGDRGLLAVRALFLAFLLVWGIRLLLLSYQGDALAASFMHWVNLPFHEAGHFVFRPFGSFLHILGGTLGQLLVPLGVAGAFLFEEDPFGAAVGVWWLGESLMDCAPYINDARARTLLLLSGETGQEDWEGHDWYQILCRLGWLRHDHALAHAAWLLGAALLLAALAWGAWVLWRQARPANPPIPR